MAIARRLAGLLSVVITLVGAVAMVLMMVHIIVDAVLRTFFASSAPGTTEFVSFYYMVAVTFLPLAYIQCLRGHVIIELFTGGLPPRVVHAIDGVVALVIAGAAGYFAFAAGWKAIAMTRAGEFVIGAILVETWPTRWFVVSGVGLLAVVALLQALDDLYTAAGGQTPEQAAERRGSEARRLESIFGLTPGKH
ncbi:TRAP transporter small permease subunit [Pseudohoeflea coraliihabitans]|uniref:TRAP transporter small permease protein n=1 Tax=Pseudohoeflea coraliihabitans TaxID=2860393 RepID=A0ABS6WK50_9HYPH|nr:TRAP transporter small permease subunit [Pseudohoeflea sp. DP4N28-3]MBW3095817.1 TRAP transporter small permease [Pseudohoeflea sp. DP4N28-3]